MRKQGNYTCQSLLHNKYTNQKRGKERSVNHTECALDIQINEKCINKITTLWVKKETLCYRYMLKVYHLLRYLLHIVAVCLHWGSAVIYLRRGGIFDDHFNINKLTTKSASERILTIGQSYRYEYNVSFLDSQSTSARAIIT